MAKVALITGGSRGIGAATALALAERGYAVAITYHNKATRAHDVLSQAQQRGVQTLAVGCDITSSADRGRLQAEVQQWRGRLDVLVLNASGGLERDASPEYPMLINRDAQVALLDTLLPLMKPGGVVVFVTSHWAHLYGRVEQIPAYEPVAASKYAGEHALRARLPELSARGIRFIVVTGDLIQGTITPKLLERAAPGLTEQRSNTLGRLPTAEEMGQAIAIAALDETLPDGHTVVIGGTLESLLA